MSRDEIYRELINWMKKNSKIPDVDKIIPSDDLILPLIKNTYTPEEAELLIGIPITNGMPFSATQLSRLARKKKMETEILKNKLDKLAKKGLVFRIQRGDKISYNILDPFTFFVRSAFWSGKKDNWTKEIASMVNKEYYNGLFDMFKNTKHKLAKVIPVEETIDDPRQIVPYEALKTVLHLQDYFAVATCACRHRKNIDIEYQNCKYPTETCIHFGDLARYIVQNGLGRQISKEEAEHILQECADLGLVHQVSNWQKDIDTICNCCECCCVWLESFKKLKHNLGHFPSNFIVDINKERCVGCGLCVSRCPMEALKLQDHPKIKGRKTLIRIKGKKKELINRSGKLVVLQPNLCIGCGVCAYKCPSDSLKLKKREKIHEPPKTAIEFSLRFLKEKTTSNN